MNIPLLLNPPTHHPVDTSCLLASYKYNDSLNITQYKINFNLKINNCILYIIQYTVYRLFIMHLIY